MLWTKADGAKYSDIKKILKISKYTRNLEQFLPDMIRVTFKLPNESDKIIEVFKLITTKPNLKKIHDVIVEVYFRTYTHAEIKAILKYLTSDIGKSINKKSGKISMEIINVTAAMATSILQENKDKVIAIMGDDFI